MSRLFFVLILQVLHCRHTVDATDRYSTAFYGQDGSTFIVSVDKRIDPSIKKKLASLDGAAAYNEFLKVYGAYLSNPVLLSSADGVTQSNREKKNQKNFLASLEEVKRHNRESNIKYDMTMNTFSVMDRSMKALYLGAGNLSDVGERERPDGLEPCRNRKTSTECQTIKLQNKCGDLDLAEQCEMTCGRCGEFKLPETLDWNARGYVTQAKDQKTCGSCWSFAAVGVLEWIYKKTTGKLMQLSEQELLDCTYDPNDTGCRGGWPWHAWKYVEKHDRLASNARYQYANSDTDCFVNNRRNMDRQFGNEIQGKFQVGKSVVLPTNRENVVIEAVNTMALFVAIYVSKDTSSGFYQLNEGIWDDCPTHMKPNHAVTLVGYGPDYWEIKNSWGVDWGRNGFGKILRGDGINMCRILDIVGYVEYTDLNPSDSEPDFPREAVVDEDEEVDCEDSPSYASVGQCPSWASYGHCTKGRWVSWMHENCPKSCNSCPTTPTCEPGQYLAPGPDANCQTCPVNTYNSDPEATSCTPCTAGSRSPAGSTSAEDCTECQPGTFLVSGSNRCEDCSENTYSSYGATACTECPEGSRSAAGATADTECIVPPEECADAFTQAKCRRFQADGHCVGGEHYSTAKWGCKMTCAFCEEIEVCENDDSCDRECIDKHENCGVWRSHGYCDESSQYHNLMKGLCSKTCEFCTVEEGCGYAADTKDFCSTWKSQGYCTNSAYVEFMRTNCATTCELCPVEKTGEGTVCKADDPTQSCDYYAKLGYCTGYWKQYMSTYCSTTCGYLCAGSCRDNNANCAHWQSTGQCETNPYYMDVNCKSSCDKCYSNSVSKVQGVPGCQDQNEYCSSWAAQGYCTSNRARMASLCAISCNTCIKKGTCGDLAGAAQCEPWAASGECTRNPGYMLVYCKGSCDACDDDSGVASSRSDTRYSYCRDSDNRCPTWAAQGYCYWYYNSCKRSCNRC